VDEGREDKLLSDLFRQKLENAEVTPSPSVSAKLMRSVGRKEFVRFNPSRINIWYAGVVAAAGTAIAVILSSSSGQKSEEPGEQLQIEIIGNEQVRTQNEQLPAVINIGAEENIKATSANRRSGMKPVNEKAPDVKSDNTLSGRSLGEPAGTQKVSSIPETGVLPDALKETKKQRISSLYDKYIAASATAGCSPFEVSFRCLAVPFDSCTWNFGDGGSSSLRNPEWLFDNAGEYKVTLQVFSSGIKSVSSIVITVYSRPVTRFEITPENAVLPQDEITFRNYSDGAEKYRWDFGDGTNSQLFEPRHIYKKYGNYSVQLISTSEYGCSDSLVIVNAFSSSGYFIELPNAFIPNSNGPSGGYFSPKSDEDSQIFHPVFSGVSEYQLRIFSKTGIMIFESNDVTYGWDGYYKGQLCDPGVYIWKVRGNFMSGEQFTKMGDLTLFKD